MNKNTLIKGTIILTIAGFLTRIIGFFYRIFLSNAMGAELLGIYQLVFPVYGICFTIFASGLQTSISRMVAAEAGRGNYKNTKRILRIGIIISFSVACLLTFLVYFNSGIIANKFLNEARCEGCLRILALVFPFCGITACINGYYYGLRKTAIPASTQLLEQIVRVIFVYCIVIILGKGNLNVTCEIAAIGLVIGEVASNIYNILSLVITKSPKTLINKVKRATDFSLETKKVTKELVMLTLPLTGNRLCLSFLHSFEAVLIPFTLKRYGLSPKEAISIFGVLNGMVIPFLMFPTAITNALAVLLLPTISEAQALGNEKQISKTTSLAMKYSLIIGILSTGIFLIFGYHLGTDIYHNEMAGNYLCILSMLCPFLYLTTTLSSVINGLGKAHITFINSIIGMSLRIVLIVVLVPRYGTMGYVISLLVSQLLITILDGRIIAKETHFTLDGINSLLKPFVTVFFSGILLLKLYEFLTKMCTINPTLILLLCCGILCVIFIGFMLLLKGISKKELVR